MDAAFGNVEQLLANLKPDPDRPDDPTAPQMMYAALTEGGIDSGVWTCAIGGWEQAGSSVDEVMVMLEGHLRLTDADGSVHDLKKGDMFFLPKGWSGRWDVLEDMKKIFVIVA